jgi:hypothetical protein
MCIYVIGVECNSRMHYTLCISLDPIVMENPLVVLCLVDRTLVEVEQQIPLMRFRAFIPWFEIGMLRI